MIALDNFLYLYLLPLFMLYLVYHFGLRKYFMDYYRQELFSTRTDLFNLALECEIKFDNEVYRMLEEQINSFIRYAHVVSLSNIILTQLAITFGFYRPKNNRLFLDVESLNDFQELSDDAKTEVKKIKASISNNTFIYYHFRSPILFLISPGVLLFTLTIHSTRSVIKDLIEKSFRFTLKDIDMSSYQDDYQLSK